MSIVLNVDDLLIIENFLKRKVKNVKFLFFKKYKEIFIKGLIKNWVKDKYYLFLIINSYILTACIVLWLF